MNPGIKKKWTSALRSGNYVQGIEYLHSFDGSGSEDIDTWCCLGVLCDLYDKDHHTRTADRPNMHCPPQQVLDWAGLEYAPLEPENDWQGEGHTPQESLYAIGELAMFNDEGATFEEIAEYIEEHL